MNVSLSSLATDRYKPLADVFKDFIIEDMDHVEIDDLVRATPPHLQALATLFLKRVVYLKYEEAIAELDGIQIMTAATTQTHTPSQ